MKYFLLICIGSFFSLSIQAQDFHQLEEDREEGASVLHYELKDSDPDKSLADIEVKILPSSDVYQLEFFVKDAQIPLNFESSSNVGAFTEGLYKENVFEFFEFDASPGSTAYVEWNLAPDGRWFYKRFDSYFKATKNQEQKRPLQIISSGSERSHNMKVSLPRMFNSSYLQPTSILLNKNKERQYYAIEHPSEKPNFHIKHQRVSH